VLAHVADTNDFVAGVDTVLSDKGVAVFEFPYLIDLVDHCAFDTIYHQHLLYLCLTTAQPIFERHGLFLNDVERIAVHGGSLRVTVGRSPNRSTAVDQLMALENRRNVRDPVFFTPLLERMMTLRTAFRALLDDYQSQGVMMAGYGAAAKAVTLLHHCGIGRSELSFIADKNEWKHGLEMPGSRIPIVHPDALDGSGVGALIILAWNFANEIMAENTNFAAGGGSFVVPVPDLTVTQGEQVRAAL
jgi:hypothetical protein